MLDKTSKTFEYKIRPNQAFITACERTLDQATYQPFLTPEGLEWLRKQLQ